mmetsp:Transcript_12184/g.16912  ORF Transcript_12184/g.16912 Transcript_12184/m.16912 type:complete len:160 (+) Transcript_12184:270-749(+)
MSAEIANVSIINSDEEKSANAGETDMTAFVTGQNAESGVTRTATAGGEEIVVAMTGMAEAIDGREVRIVSNVGIQIPMIAPSITGHHETTCTMTVTTMPTGELRIVRKRDQDLPMCGSKINSKNITKGLRVKRKKTKPENRRIRNRKAVLKCISLHAPG